jgi:YidC/Oxa1 family membrane protein insertase
MEIQRALVITGIAIVSYLMIQAWQQDYANPTQPAPVEEVAQSAQGNGDGLDLPSPQADEVDNGIPSAQSERVEAPSSESTETTTRQQRIRVNTDVLRVEIDPQGGDIVRLALPEFPHHVDTPDQPFVLLEQDASRTYVAQSGLIGKNGTDSSAGRPLWSAAQQSYQLDEGTQELNVDLTLRQDNGAELVKRFTFERGSYLVRVSHIVRNQGNSEWSGALYGQIKRDGSEDPGLSNSGFIPMPTYLGGAYWDSETPYNKLDFEEMAENPLDLTVQGGWLAMAQHYFVTAWVPDAQQKNHYSSVHLEKRGQYLLRFVSPTLKVAPGEEKVLYAEFYAGPKQQDKLEAISPGLNMTVDYGWLWFISQPIFALLVFLQSGEVSVFGMDIDIGMGVGNWGVAIILLTLTIKAIFFKLSATSYRSMAKMRKVAPEMQRIKEQNKNDKQNGNHEVVPARKDQPAGWLSADAGSDAGVYRSLLCVAGIRGAASGTVLPVDQRSVSNGSVLRPADPDGRLHVPADPPQSDPGRSHAGPGDEVDASGVLRVHVVVPCRSGAVLADQQHSLHCPAVGNHPQDRKRGITGSTRYSLQTGRDFPAGFVLC